MLADSQNTSDFDNLRLRKIGNSKRLGGSLDHPCVPNKVGGLTSLLVENKLTRKTLQVH